VALALGKRSAIARIVAPFGFYGWGNIGDEATLNGFAQLLGQTGCSPRVSIGSQSPAHTASVEPAFGYFRPAGVDPRRWWAKARASAFAVIGGTAISDMLGEWPLRDLVPLVADCERRGLPFVFIGTGIEDLARDESRRTVAAEIAPRVRRWTVRSQRDRERLIDYGVRAERVDVASDMAWLIPPSTDQFGQECLKRWRVPRDRTLVGVSLVNENHCFDRLPGFADAVARSLDSIIERFSAHVVFLAQEVRSSDAFDLAAAERVLRRMDRRTGATIAPAAYIAPREFMSIVACCSLTLSMRYHFCIFSALQGVPFIGIERSSKVSDLCWDLRWPAHLLPTALRDDELIAHAQELLEHGAQATQELSQRAARMKGRAMLNIEAIRGDTSG
jgi:polysaccharide pyruvyl transferase WcaK-like protein